MLIILSVFLALNGCQFKNNSDNPVSTPTTEDNNIALILNGDFEVSTDKKIPDNWITNIVGKPAFDFFDVDSTVMESGKNSLKITFIDSLSNPNPESGSWGGLYQILPITNLTAGQRYYLKFWAKSTIGNFQIRLLKNGVADNPILSYIVQPTPSWTEYKMGFQIDTTTTFMWILVSTKPALSKDGRVSGWLDNVGVISKP